MIELIENNSNEELSEIVLNDNQAAFLRREAVMKLTKRHAVDVLEKLLKNLEVPIWIRLIIKDVIQNEHSRILTTEGG